MKSILIFEFYLKTSKKKKRSLLVYISEKESFFHFDSAGKYNSTSAKIVAKRFYSIIRPNSNKFQFNEPFTPPQKNGLNFFFFSQTKI